MVREKRPFLLAIAAWQAVSLIMYYIFTYSISYLVLAAYTEWVGDVQESYEIFERVNTYLATLIITAPATLVSIMTFAKASGLSTGWKRTFVTFIGWLSVVLAALICSYETGFSYKIHQIDWMLFGPPENLYGFRNLVLHRIVAWLTITTPVAFAALWLHRKCIDSKSEN